jgi:hypothetical protein
MITMLSNSLIQQHNANGWTCHITMKCVSEDSSCSMVGWGAMAACDEMSTGSVQDLKAKHSQKVHMNPHVYGTSQDPPSRQTLHRSGLPYGQSVPKIRRKPLVPRVLYVEPRVPMWSADLADVVAVDGSWGQQFLACHCSAYSDTCTPVGGGSVEVGDKVSPWQGVFPLSSHTCLAWDPYLSPRFPTLPACTTCLPFL